MKFRQVKWDMLHPFSDNAQWHSVFGQKNMQHSQVLWTTNSCWKFVNCSIQEGCYISYRNCKHVCTATGYMYEWSGFWAIFIPLSHTTTQNKLTRSVTYSTAMSFTSATVSGSGYKIKSTTYEQITMSFIITYNVNYYSELYRIIVCSISLIKENKNKLRN